LRVRNPSLTPKLSANSVSASKASTELIASEGGVGCGRVAESPLNDAFLSLQRQLAERTGELPAQHEPFPQPYLNVQAENAIIDRILEVLNATGLTAHQAKRCLERVKTLIEIGERVATRTLH